MNPYEKKNYKRKKRNPTADDLILQATDVLASVKEHSRKTSEDTPKQSALVDADDLFFQSMARLAKEIPDPMSKEMAKIEIQQILFKYRFQSHHLQQTVNLGDRLNASNHGYQRSQMTSASYQPLPKSSPSYPSTLGRTTYIPRTPEGPSTYQPCMTSDSQDLHPFLHHILSKMQLERVKKRQQYQVLLKIAF